MKGIIFVAAFITFIITGRYLWGIMPSTTPSEYGQWALLLLALNLAPSLHYVLFRRRNVPLMPLVGLFYALSFSFPVFYIPLNEYQLGYLREEALELAFYGLSCFYAAYYLFYANMKRIKIFIPVKQLYVDNVRFLKVLMYSFLVVSTLGKFFPVATFRHFYEPGIYIFAGIYLLLYLKGKLTPVESMLLGFVILSEFATRLAVSLLAKIARYMLFLTIVYYTVKRKVPLVSIAVAAIILVLLLPVKLEFRGLMKETEGTLGTKERLEIFYDLAKDHYLAETRKVELHGEEMRRESALWRFSYSSSAFSKVIELTPHQVPYWDGHTYTSLLTKFIPRILWPGKPKEGMGQEFGHRYHLLDANDTTTSMNLPWLAELYANFGREAVFFGMGLFGLLFAFVDRFYNSDTNTANVIISAAVYFPIITHESNFALEAGNMFLLTVAIHFFIQFVQRNVHIKEKNN